MSTKVKRIRARLALFKMPDGDLKPLLHGSLKGLSENATIFPRPPVELAAYKAAIEAYEAAIPAALDGSKPPLRRKTACVRPRSECTSNSPTMWKPTATII